MREILEHLINKVDSKSLVKNVDKNYLVAIARFFSRFNIIPLKEYHLQLMAKIFILIFLLQKNNSVGAQNFQTKKVSNIHIIHILKIKVVIYHFIQKELIIFYEVWILFNLNAE